MSALNKMMGYLGLVDTDEDAQQQALRYTMQFQNQGITTKNIKPTDKDASDMGFTEVNNKLKESKKTGFGDIISQKLKGL